MPPKTKLVPIRKVRPEERTAVQAMADDIERIVMLGERVVGAVGGANALMRAGADKILAPAIRRALEEQIRDLEQENGYMREVLLSLVDRDGPIVVDRPYEKGRLAITVDIRNKKIDVRRES